MDQSREQLLRDIFLSISLHILLAALLMLIPSPPPPASQNISIDLIPQSEMPKPLRSIVRAHEIDENQKDDNSKDPLRFLSDKLRRVKEQMRARESGLTQNRSPHAASANSNAAAEGQKEKPKTLDSDGLERFLPQKIKAPPTISKAASHAQGTSTFAEDLPSDVKVGEITSLNTDRYLYYSYFARAQELLWNEWAPRVEMLLERPTQQLQSSPGSKFTTVVEVWFYPDGRVHSTHLLKPSGVREFDVLAEASFRHIQVIPNPPKEKIEADGLIRFPWSLTVEYNPKVLVRQ